MKQFCKGCGAEILWVKMESGRAGPVDVAKTSVVIDTPTGGKVVTGHVSHFATCPVAARFRSKKKEPSAAGSPEPAEKPTRPHRRETTAMRSTAATAAPGSIPQDDDDRPIDS